MFLISVPQVSLFFQQEVVGRASRLTAAAFPVLLLSGDNTQVCGCGSVQHIARVAVAAWQGQNAPSGSQPFTPMNCIGLLGTMYLLGLQCMHVRRCSPLCRSRRGAATACPPPAWLTWLRRRHTWKQPWGAASRSQPPCCAPAWAQPP